jgi:hypothetical protein
MGSNPGRSIIKNLVSGAVPGRPLSLEDLDSFGVSPYLAAKYARTGWLVRLGPGLYRLTSPPLDRGQSLLVLQERVLGLHVAGRTALAWQGVRHNIDFDERLTLRGSKPGALPAWFTQAFPCTYRSTALFTPDADNLGIFTPPSVTAGVRVSTRERALVELLRDAGQGQDMDEAIHLFEATAGLRTPVLGQLLSQCLSVKAVRMVLLWGERVGNVDVSALRRDYTLPTGSASRWVGTLDDGSNLVLPPC